MALNIERLYQCLRNFDFANLLVEELGWSLPVNVRPTSIMSGYSRLEIARLSDIPVFEIHTTSGEIPDALMRNTLYEELVPLFRKSLFIFLDEERTQSLWYWRKHEENVSYKHEYVYMRGQPEDLFFNKLDSIISDLLPPQETRNQRKRKNDRLKPVSNAIVEAFNTQRLQFSQQIKGIEKEQDRELYAMILLCRLMFLSFLQHRHFFDKGNETYLEWHLQAEIEAGRNYYRDFLLPLCNALSNPVFTRREDHQTNPWNVPYLGAGLFSPHSIELLYTAIHIPNEAFSQIFAFFSPYEWRIVDIVVENQAEAIQPEITPDILGAIFEAYFNRLSQSSAYAMPSEITEYFCKQTIQQFILDKLEQQKGSSQRRASVSFQHFLDTLDQLNVKQFRSLLFEILPELSILDPACGSGTFLLAALNTLLLVYSKLVSKIADFHDAELNNWLETLHKDHPNQMYTLKKRIIACNLFGVDIVDEAIELARLRLYLALISSLDTLENLEPLPDIDFNLYSGNSLIGFLRLKDTTIFYYTSRDTLLAHFREMPQYYDDLSVLKTRITRKQAEETNLLNDELLEQFQLLQSRHGYRIDRRLRSSQSEELATLADIKQLHPLHWCSVFDQIMNQRGGFDVIITSPPWETLKKSTDPIKSYQNLYYEFAPQYTHQRTINKRRVIIQTSIHTYKLFLEQCFNLLRDNGYCGIFVPNSICSNEDTGELRQLLFLSTCVTGLFCFENRREILPGVDPRFECALLSFEKSRSTETFPFAFSRQAIEDLEHFPGQHAIPLSIAFIHHFSPDALAIGKFKDRRDIAISEKMMAFSPLRETTYNSGKLTLSSGAFFSHVNQVLQTRPENGALPLYEGKMIYQFTHDSASLRYWLDRQVLVPDKQQRFSPLASAVKRWHEPEGHGYHLVFRSSASSTGNRTLVATILPPDTFVNNTLNFVSSSLRAEELLFLTALFNSFIVDFAIRLRVITHLSLEAVYQIPIPHLDQQDGTFWKIVARAAQLICTSEDFKALWESVMPEPWSLEAVATNQVERDQLCAELEGLITQIYNITEENFIYILSTFPFVSTPTKVAARNAYRDMKRGLLS